MEIWYRHFWHAIILAGILAGLITVGGAGAVFLWVVRETVKDFGHKTNCLLFKIADSSLHFYKKSAQWVGSIIIALLIIGVIGRLAIFTFTHWREIWGP